MSRTRRGQSVLEYVILIVIVIAALITLQSYIKRGIQGRLKSASDDIGEQFTTVNGYTFTKTVNSFTNTTEKSSGGSTNTETHNSITSTTRNTSGLQDTYNAETFN